MQNYLYVNILGEVFPRFLLRKTTHFTGI